jgi:hypothetical protein
MQRFESYSRLTEYFQYKNIAEENLDIFYKTQSKALEIRSKISEFLSNSECPDCPPIDHHYQLRNQLSSLENIRNQSCIIAVVFTAMYFEALIYDYSASCLGDRYSKDHLDKLDFLSKWMIIPKLITGKEISKSGQAYELLKKLHKDRNSLVHLKSKELILSHDVIAEHIEKEEKDIEQSATNCRMALKQVIIELSEIDPTHPQILSTQA